MTNTEDVEAQTSAGEVALSATSRPPAVPSPGKTLLPVLGYEPEPGEVAELVEVHLRQRLVAECDRAQLDGMLSGLRSGEVASGTAYRVLAAAVAGPIAEYALKVLGALYDPQDVLELRAVSPVGGAVSFNGRLAEHRDAMAAFLREHNGRRNIYVGINPRRAGLAGKHSAANENDIACRRHVVLDLDNKEAPDAGPGADPQWTRTVENLRAHGPAMVTSSGNGWHIWFPIETVADKDVQATVGPLANAMAAIGADNMADPPRIIRLPGTINIPTKSKLKRKPPARLALSRVVDGPHPAAGRRPVAVTARLFIDCAAALNLPGRSSGTRAKSKAKARQSSAPRTSDEDLRAPSGLLLETALSFLPNTEKMDRVYQTFVAHMVRGACSGTDFEDIGRAAFLEWSARWPWGGDRDHDERIYDTIKSTRTGWRHLKEQLQTYNPAGSDQIRDLEEPFRLAALRAVFSDFKEGELEAFGIKLPSQEDEPSQEDRADETEDRPPALPSSKGLAAAALERLVQLGHAAFFNSPDGKLWVQLRGRVYRIDEGKGCRPAAAWLVQQGITLTGNAKNDLKDQMVARALGGPTRGVHYRQATGRDRHKPEAFLNLMDGGGWGVHIEAGQWRITPLSTFAERMADRPHALPLPHPIQANDGLGFFDRLVRHVRLAPVQSAADPHDRGIQQRAAVLMVLCAQLYRPGAVPHLLVSGPQGASKTTTARRIKALVDPDTADVVTAFPDKVGEVYAIAEQQSLVVTDNISRVQSPDLLSALATGAASQQRELYSDGGRVVFRAKTSIVMTTVLDEITRRPDLMDRIVRLDLPALDQNDRRTETELDIAWTADLPHLLADLLDLVSGALARWHYVAIGVDTGLLPSLPRLADAALLGEAAAQVAGWPVGLFLSAINAARESEAGRQLEESPVATRIRDLLVAQGGIWTGTTKELLQRIRFVDGPDWDTSGNNVHTFTNALDRLAGPLREAWGIELERTRSHGARRLTIRRARR